MADAVLALGSNLGDSAATLQGAVDALGRTPGVAVTAVSPAYRTAPVGGPAQDDYLNAVVLVRTTLAPEELLQATAAIEQAWHRVREVRWGPRTLDIDLITVGDTVLDTPDLVLPHPRAHERAFVLVPWLAVDPQARLVGRGPVAELLAGLDAADVVPVDVPLTMPEGSGR